jgi:hypothetical protein
MAKQPAREPGQKSSPPTGECDAPSQDIGNLANNLFVERIRRARDMSVEEKFVAGLRLFDRTCSIMCDGIRAEYPDADERRVQEILRERLALARRLEKGR